MCMWSFCNSTYRLTWTRWGTTGKSTTISYWNLSGNMTPLSFFPSRLPSQADAWSTWPATRRPSGRLGAWWDALLDMNDYPCLVVTPILSLRLLLIWNASVQALHCRYRFKYISMRSCMYACWKRWPGEYAIGGTHEYVLTIYKRLVSPYFTTTQLCFRPLDGSSHICITSAGLCFALPLHDKLDGLYCKPQSMEESEPIPSKTFLSMSRRLFSSFYRTPQSPLPKVSISVFRL